MRAKAPASAAGVRLLVLDVDGVLTDGTLVFSSAGEETKRFHVRDGYAIQQAQRAGLAIAVISGRASAAVTRRMTDLGVTEVYQGAGDKAAVFRDLLARLRVSASAAAVMGDDLPDLPLMRMAGLALAPADAVAEVKRAVGWVSRFGGGEGAVREAIEMLLRARKAWPPKT